MQTVTYGCGMPVYCLVHLFTSLTAISDQKALAKHTDIRNTDVLRDIPFSMLIGY